MAPNTRQPTDVKARTYEYHVILARRFKSSEPTMAVFQSLFAIRMDIQIGASIVCHILRREYYNESKFYFLFITHFLYVHLEYEATHLSRLPSVSEVSWRL